MRKSNLYLLLCLLFLCFAIPGVQAQQVFKTTKTSVIGYLEYLPQDYNSNSNKYPIVIFLHGIGERGANSTDPAVLNTTIQNVAKNGPPLYVKNGTQFPFILISPQLKNNYGDWPSAYVMEVINHVKTYLRIDERRIYLTGLSLGGGGTWWTAQDYPEFFAAIAPVCGSRNTVSKACALAGENLPVWAFHGDQDTTVPMSRTVNMINAINSCSPVPSPLAKITIYPGVAHSSWTNAYKTDHTLHNPNVYEWMLSYTNTRNKGNQIPVANAGADKTIGLLSSLVLSGSGTDADGTIASYTWTQISGPSAATLLNNLTKSLTISSLLSGTYVFRLTVKDNSGNTDSDYIKITVDGASTANTLPVVNAGADKSITLPTNSVSLKGTATDSDGSIASYAWTKVSGGAVSMTGTATAMLNCSGMVAGSYVFRLTASDNTGGKKSDDVSVTVKSATTATTTANIAPVANAGADQRLVLPTNAVTLHGGGTDSDGSIVSYQWKKTAGGAATLSGANTATLQLSNLAAGSYYFRLTVTDNKGATDYDDMLVSVKAPTTSSARTMTIEQIEREEAAPENSPARTDLAVTDFIREKKSSVRKSGGTADSL